jgi:hypothetical protein
MKESIPVMIISLAESHNKCMGKTLNLIVPLPWFESCGVYVQGAKADKTRDDLSCNVYEYPRGSR